jgi:hypothetical protein
MAMAGNRRWDRAAKSLPKMRRLPRATPSAPAMSCIASAWTTVGRRHGQTECRHRIGDGGQQVAPRSQPLGTAHPRLHALQSACSRQEQGSVCRFQIRKYLQTSETVDNKFNKYRELPLEEVYFYSANYWASSGPLVSRRRRCLPPPTTLAAVRTAVAYITFYRGYLLYSRFIGQTSEQTEGHAGPALQ